MRRFRWLPWLSSSVAVLGTSLLLSPALKAETLDEAKVKGALMLRFDENRNDKLDAGEARQTRARLKNLLEDKSEREINIVTWRDDVRELLQAIDTDSDNRLSVPERDAGRDLLNRLIPVVDPTAPKERETSAPLSSSKKDRDAERESERSRRLSRGSGGSYGSSGGHGYGGMMGGGGFGMSGFGNTNSDQYNPWLKWLSLNSGASGSSTGGGASGGGASGGGASGGGASGGSSGSGAGGMGSMSAGMDGMSGSRPGMGDPGSSMGGSFGGAMAGTMGNMSSGAMSSLGGGSLGSQGGAGSPNPFGPDSGASATPSIPQGPLGDAQPVPGLAPGSTPGAGATPTTPGGGIPGGMPGGAIPMPPDGLGGGMPPGGIPGGGGGTSAVPSNPMPNF